MDTTTITTSGNHTIELRTFITGRQSRYIMAAFMDDVEITQTGGEQSFSVQANKASVAQDRAIESVVVSVDGKTENVVSLVLDLPASDTDEVIAKVDEITGGRKKELSTPAN